jgi:photosystem II stability/assembly factor-like uncharacterized protein
MNGRSVSDITFVDSLIGYAVTNYQAPNDTDYILKTTNGGDNWNIIRIDGQQFAGFNVIDFLNKDTGYTCGVSNFPINTSIQKTTNGGQNWLNINPPEASATYYGISVLNNDTIWVVDIDGLTGGVFRTTNGGLNWTQQLNLGSQNPNHIYMFNSRIGFASTGAGLYKTTNSGVNWFLVTGGHFFDIHFADSLTGWKCANNIQKTTDGGNTWSLLPFPPKTDSLLFSRIDKFSFVGRDTIWGVGGLRYYPIPNIARAIIWLSTDGGQTWGYQQPDPSITIFLYYHIQFINKLNGWAYATTSGVHTKVGGDTTYFTGIKQVPNYIPAKFTLGQNFPNPFNPTTSIPFELREASYVTFKVYDVRGVLVKELVNGGWSASKYVSEFDGSGLSSGVYFYKLDITGNNSKERFTQSKRMTLIK